MKQCNCLIRCTSWPIILWPRSCFTLHIFLEESVQQYDILKLCTDQITMEPSNCLICCTSWIILWSLVLLHEFVAQTCSVEKMIWSYEIHSKVWHHEALLWPGKYAEASGAWTVRGTIICWLSRTELVVGWGGATPEMRGGELLLFSSPRTGIASSRFCRNFGSIGGSLKMKVMCQHTCSFTNYMNT